MADAELSPAMEGAMPATPDIVLDGDGHKAGEVLVAEGHKDGEVLVDGGGRASEGAEPSGDDAAGIKLGGIVVEDPSQANITAVDEPEVGAGPEVQMYEVGSGPEVQMDEVAGAVDDPIGPGVAVTSSIPVDDPAAFGASLVPSTSVDETLKAGAALAPSTSVDDPTEVCAGLLHDDSNIVSTGGMCRSDGQIGQEFDGGSLDDAYKTSHPVNGGVLDDGARMEKDDTVSDEGGHAQHAEEPGPQTDATAAMLNEVETELVKSGEYAAEGANMDMQMQTADDNEVEGVGIIASGADDEVGKLMGSATGTGDDKEKEFGAASFDATGEGLQTDIAVVTGYDNEQKKFATTIDDSVEEVGKHTDAVTMTGNTDEEGRITGENIADEAADAAVGIDVPEEKVQMDGAIDDIPQGEASQMDGACLAGIDNEQKEVVTANDYGVEEDTIHMDAAALANDEDEEDGIGIGDAANEAVNGTVGDDTPEEVAVHVDDEDDDDDDDDEPPPLLTRKGGGRGKRGRPSSKSQAVAKPFVKRKDEEDVCFICFDGGNLVICDRRGCPKAYHPSCVNRDDDFFKTKGRWNCGWHICSNCQKPARHMCYTCTYSLCKTCMKDTSFISVRGFKGLCETCMNTVMMIENREEATDQMDVDFDDKTSWWYLFKDYWLNLKANLSLTLEEILTAKSQKSASSLVIRDSTNYEESNSVSNLAKKRGRKRLKQAVTEDGFEGKEGTKKSKKLSDAQASGKKARKSSRRALSSKHPSMESESIGTSSSSAEESGWASKELLNFIAHMRNGDRSVVTHFEVQTLLLEYVKRNNLRNPHKKSQIVCDSLLQSLFGKERVGHFEMLKLLESHFLTSEVSPMDADDNHGGVVDPDPSLDADGNSEASAVGSSEKRRKSRKHDQRGRQPNLDDYAAIDNHNIGLMYLRRNLVEELIADVDTFDEKVIGSFVRIRIPGTGQRQDIYRLVQIVGTGRAAENYKCGKRTTDITLEILNLDKREVVTIDIISNQEFTEEECKRLRQSIKYGFIPRLTVGEVREKAGILQAVKVNDWIESEKMRLAHLRDRASDMGHRKELRECVEKLKLLSTPEERVRRLNEEPEIHADPAMDPDYESPEEQEQEIERSSFNKSRGSLLRKDGNVPSPGKGDGRNALQRDPKSNSESNRNTWSESSSHIESPLSRRATFSLQGESAAYANKSESSNIGAQTVRTEGTARNAQQGLSGFPSETLAANVGTAAKPASQPIINESEKIWLYVDPANKVQGPFSFAQLRKWNSGNFFPPDLKIWKASEKQEDSILLTDALMGKFEKDLPQWEPPQASLSQMDKTYLRSSSDIGARSSNSPLVDSKKDGEHAPKSVAPNRSQSFSGRDQTRDYSTTDHGSAVTQSGMQGYYGMQNSQVAYASQQALNGSWNAPSSQFGVSVNPMTPMQPVAGVFAVGQNIAVAGSMGNLTPVPAPATANAEMVNSAVPSQNPISSVLQQKDERLADRNESKSGEVASHGRASSSGEGLGTPGIQPGHAQLSTQQTEGTRNQTDASSSRMPSQLISTPSVESVQPSNIAGGDSQRGISAQVADTSGQAQVAGNVTWGSAPQGDASMAWGMMGQNNMNMPWGAAQVQGATSYNMGLTMPMQANTVPNMGWLTPNTANTNMNMIWAATQGQGTQNAAAMMGAQMQGVAMAPWGGIAPGNANPYQGWGTQQAGNMNQNVGWSGPLQGNQGQVNNNMNWNSQNGNPDWNNQQRDNGSRHSGGRSWKPRSGGGGGGGGRAPDGVCWEFFYSGTCRKIECRFRHERHNDGYPSRNDRQFDGQHSGSQRRYENHSERNDRQFDRQPSVNERQQYYNRHDDRRGDENPGDRQADRSQSREPR